MDYKIRAVLLIWLLSISDVTCQRPQLTAYDFNPESCVIDNEDTISMTGKADMNGVNPNVWPLRISFNTPDETVCSVDVSSGCIPAPTTACYCTQGVGTVYNVTLNLTALTRFNNKAFSLGMSSTLFETESSSQSFPPPFISSSLVKSLAIDGISISLNSNDITFEAEGSGNHNLTYCVKGLSSPYTMEAVATSSSHFSNMSVNDTECLSSNDFQIQSENLTIDLTYKETDNCKRNKTISLTFTVPVTPLTGSSVSQAGNNDFPDYAIAIICVIIVIIIIAVIIGIFYKKGHRCPCGRQPLTKQVTITICAKLNITELIKRVQEKLQMGELDPDMCHNKQCRSTDPILVPSKAPVASLWVECLQITGQIIPDQKGNRLVIVSVDADMSKGNTSPSKKTTEIEMTTPKVKFSSLKREVTINSLRTETKVSELLKQVQQDVPENSRPHSCYWKCVDKKLGHDTMLRDFCDMDFKVTVEALKKESGKVFIYVIGMAVLPAVDMPDGDGPPRKHDMETFTTKNETNNVC